MSVISARISLILSFVMLCCFSTAAQRTTRPALKAVERPSRPVASAMFDTVTIDTSCVRLSGYEKTLRSSIESVFITNKSDIELSSIMLQIQYFDMNDRQLHMRQVEVEATVPPGETRLARFTSWDKQKVWYYYLSDPVRTRMQCTPYKVTISPIRALASHAPESADGIDE